MTEKPDPAPAERPAGAAPERPPERPQVTGLRRLGKIFATVVAPGTLSLALLYYFGWSHTASYFEHFGVDSSLVTLSTADYLVRSIDALFIPLTASVLAGLLTLWARAVIREHVRPSDRPGVRRAVIWVLAAVGSLLTVGGIISVFHPTVLSEHLLLAPLSLTVGAPLVAYAYGLWRTRDAKPPSGTTAVAEWAIVFTLVAIGLFWAATDYSSAVGTSKARRFLAELPVLPSAVVYSERSLSMTAHGVIETPCRNKDAAYRFRYDGLTLVIRAAGHYVLIPSGWSEPRAQAIVLPIATRTNAVRLEYVPPLARLHAPRPVC